MWNSTIANFKENLSRIALDVHDVAEELEATTPPSNGRSSFSNLGVGEDASVLDRDHHRHRKISHRFPQSHSHAKSPVPNGIDSSHKAELEWYKAELRRLQGSEAELKALSVNYAAILKEREEHLSGLREENEALRKNLEAKKVIEYASTSGNVRKNSSSSVISKGESDSFSIMQHKRMSQVSGHSTANHSYAVNILKQDISTDGKDEAIDLDALEQKLKELQGNKKDLEDLHEEKQRALDAVQANYEAALIEAKHLTELLDVEQADIASTKLQLQGNTNPELSAEIKELRNEVNNRMLDIKRLQSELNRREMEKPLESVDNLKSIICSLEKEKDDLKSEMDKLVNALQQCQRDAKDSNPYICNPNEVQPSDKMLGPDGLTISQREWDQTLKAACGERDKALQELARLKQHLIDKELEESEKMDEDSRLIEELQATSECQANRILQLETALKQALSNVEEFKKNNSSELQRSNELISDLNRKLGNCMQSLESKKAELLNLQTALGQYYAESEAKERLVGELAIAREESSRLSEFLKDTNHRLEMAKQEKDDVLVKLSQAERLFSESQNTVHRLEEDNSKLRRALEQSMTRLNRMSLDSDYFVDRRIVIKLLVTYFQRNHSKEVLDLMVRLLGFSEEDKQRIGFAQHAAGKGVVRGVLGLPGRLVGGIMGGSSSGTSSHLPSESQSFADLWVDFLLKETEERDRRENAVASARLGASPSKQSPQQPGTSSSSTADSGTRVYAAASGASSHIHIPREPQGSPESEFSTVPLTSSTPQGTWSSRFVPRY
ncbi:hypothetical protein AMTRI_Chr01g107660 [Amborella trichopoda]